MKKANAPMAICFGLLGAGVLLVVAGVTGVWVLLPLVGCMLMMGMMMWIMGGSGHVGDKK
jgi:hypothetical protein